MNKEEIEEAKKNYIFTTEHELDNNNKRLKEYVEYLESKLNKVTDKLKEPITEKNINVKASKLFKVVYKDLINITKEKTIAYVNEYRKEILEIIEGEKK